MMSVDVKNCAKVNASFAVAGVIDCVMLCNETAVVLGRVESLHSAWSSALDTRLVLLGTIG
jgi:hypothetical protein